MQDVSYLPMDCRMNMRQTICSLVFVIGVAGCGQKTEPEQADDPAFFQMRWDALATTVMERTQLSKGERVLLVARPGRFDPLIVSLSQKIEQSGAVYLGTISVDTADSPPEWETEFVKEAATKDLPDLAAHLASVDLGIMLPGASVSHAPYAAMQQVLRTGHGRTIHFHWSGAYSLSGVPLAETADIDQLYQHVILTTDYNALASAQEDFERLARNQSIQVTTTLGTDLTFSIGDRPVTKQDGNASQARSEVARNLIDREIEIPAGAIRVAPIESSVKGKIAFPDSEWSGEPVTGLVLTITSGRVTNIAATSGRSAVVRELEAAGDAGFAFREFALGFNPLLTIPEIGPRYIPYYGYGAGIVRLSLGDNTELGGNVGGGYVRWNFFVDASVVVGDRVVVKDGRMLPFE
jgi:hypothetical protein